MTVVADFSQLTALATQLAAAPTRLAALAPPVVREGVQSGRDNAQSLIRSQIRGVYLPHYPDAITAEMTSPLSGEFGPETSREQGAFGPGVEYGSSNAGPLPHMGPAADALAAAFPREIAQVAVEALW